MKTYKTTFDLYKKWHFAKYRCHMPYIEVLGEENSFLPLTTLAQAMDFMEAMAYAPEPIGQKPLSAVMSRILTCSTSAAARSGSSGSGSGSGASIRW